MRSKKVKIEFNDLVNVYPRLELVVQELEKRNQEYGQLREGIEVSYKEYEKKGVKHYSCMVKFKAKKIDYIALNVIGNEMAITGFRTDYKGSAPLMLLGMLYWINHMENLMLNNISVWGLCDVGHDVFTRFLGFENLDELKKFFKAEGTYLEMHGHVILPFKIFNNRVNEEWVDKADL